MKKHRAAMVAAAVAVAGIALVAIPRYPEGSGASGGGLVVVPVAGPADLQEPVDGEGRVDATAELTLESQDSPGAVAPPNSGELEPSDEDGLYGQESDAEWEAYVLAQPQWAGDDSQFKDKYDGFTGEEMKRAKKILSGAIRLEEEGAVPRRFVDGDYADTTGLETLPLPRSEGQSVKMYTVQHREIAGEIRTLVFEFPESEYPALYYRGRELDYLVKQLHKQGVKLRD